MKPLLTKRFGFSKRLPPSWEAPTTERQLPAITFADLKIRTKERQLVTFAPNDVQETYLDLLAAEYEEFDWKNGVYRLRGAREDVLKARQQGLSTLWLALFFLDTVNNP